MAFYTVIILILSTSSDLFFALLPCFRFPLHFCDGSLAQRTSVFELLDPLTNAKQAESVIAAIKLRLVVFGNGVKTDCTGVGLLIFAQLLDDLLVDVDGSAEVGPVGDGESGHLLTV